MTWWLLEFYGTDRYVLLDLPDGSGPITLEQRAPKMETDFLVIGGGIDGAVFAELVGRRGKRVIVLEKTIAPPNWVRPEILWPATTEILFRLIPRMVWVREAMLPLLGVTISDGRRTVPFVTSEILRQTQIQRVFLEP